RQPLVHTLRRTQLGRELQLLGLGLRQPPVDRLDQERVRPDAQRSAHRRVRHQLTTALLAHGRSSSPAALVVTRRESPSSPGCRASASPVCAAVNLVLMSVAGRVSSSRAESRLTASSRRLSSSFDTAASAPASTPAIPVPIQIPRRTRRKSTCSATERGTRLA